MTSQLWNEENLEAMEVSALFGELDQNKKLIEERLAVHILYRDGRLWVEGEEADVSAALSILQSMIKIVRRQDFITRPEVEYLIRMQNQDAQVPVEEIMENVIITTAHGRPIRPKTLGQKKYIDDIQTHGFTFGIGPAGTGKTYLAVAMAVKAFKANEVNRIILTRPAVEAGESLGYLPGDLQEKLDPYLRPLYDALFEILGHDNYIKLKERGQIEVAPLAYMRGRTLDNSFIILDEAQNTSIQQMKMFLTRLGYGSKAVINGDVTQIDLPKGKRSGLQTIQRILKDVDGISFCYFNRADVVRHPLVQRVIDAFSLYEKKEEEEEKKEAEQKAQGPEKSSIEWKRENGGQAKGGRTWPDQKRKSR